MVSSTWALSQISKILPLDHDSLQEILDYSSTLSEEAAAEHLKDLLGDSQNALNFISAFNSHREPQATDSSPSPAPVEVKGKPRKKKANFNKLPPPRQPENYGNVAGRYLKKEDDDYIAASRRPRQDGPAACSSSSSPRINEPAARELPTPTTTNKPPKAPPSASGPLISDLPNFRTSTRTAPPTAKAKVNISGGSAMHGASTILQDLVSVPLFLPVLAQTNLVGIEDSAIRALEIQTNPSLSTSTPVSARRCNCQATRHPLLAAAPNCLSCGKIICVKEGIGPCTFCSSPLLSQSQIQSMLRSLKDDRGAEKMNLNNASQKRADLAHSPRPFSSGPSLPPSNAQPLPFASSPSPSSSTADASLVKALAHRDRLLSYQAQNTARTRVIDEAADFETPSAGQSMWSSPEERARQLKRQQKLLREQEWNARPEYEKRRVVLSLDLVGGKAIKRMGKVEMPREDDDVEDLPTTATETTSGSERGKGNEGSLSNNPLLRVVGLVRPIWKPKDDHNSSSTPNPIASVTGSSTASTHVTNSKWRRVQDELEDNEALLLDGGIYGNLAAPDDTRHWR